MRIHPGSGGYGRGRCGSGGGGWFTRVYEVTFADDVTHRVDPRYGKFDGLVGDPCDLATALMNVQQRTATEFVASTQPVTIP